RRADMHRLRADRGAVPGRLGCSYRTDLQVAAEGRSHRRIERHDVGADQVIVSYAPSCGGAYAVAVPGVRLVGLVSAAGRLTITVAAPIGHAFEEAVTVTCSTLPGITVPGDVYAMVTFGVGPYRRATGGHVPVQL